MLARATVSFQDNTHLVHRIRDRPRNKTTDLPYWILNFLYGTKLSCFCFCFPLKGFPSIPSCSFVLVPDEFCHRRAVYLGDYRYSWFQQEFKKLAYRKIRDKEGKRHFGFSFLFDDYSLHSCLPEAGEFLAVPS